MTAKLSDEIETVDAKATKRASSVKTILGIDAAPTHTAIAVLFYDTVCHEVVDNDLPFRVVLTHTGKRRKLEKFIASAENRFVYLWPQNKVCKTTEERLEVLAWLQFIFRELLCELRPDTIVIEDYSFSSPQGAHQVGEVGGVLRLEARSSLPFQSDKLHFVSPKSLKKFAIGNGNATKSEVVAALHRRAVIENSQVLDSKTLLDHANEFTLARVMREVTNDVFAKAHQEDMAEAYWLALWGVDKLST